MDARNKIKADFLDWLSPSYTTKLTAHIKNGTVFALPFFLVSEEAEKKETSHIIFLMFELTPIRSKEVIRSIFRFNDKDITKPITFVINTNGGDIDEAFAVYDAMKLSSAPIYTLGLGKIMSAGTLLLAAGTLGERRIGCNARLMFHGGNNRLNGDVEQVRQELCEFERQDKLFDELVANECSRTLQEVEALYKPSRLDNYMTAEQVVAFGFADSIAKGVPK